MEEREYQAITQLKQVEHHTSVIHVQQFIVKAFFIQLVEFHLNILVSKSVIMNEQKSSNDDVA